MVVHEKNPLHKIKPKKTRVFEFSSPLKNYRKTILHDSNFIHPYPAPFNSINSNFQSPKTFTARFHPRFKPQTSHFFFFFPPTNESTTRESQWPGCSPSAINHEQPRDQRRGQTKPFLSQPHDYPS